MSHSSPAPARVVGKAKQTRKRLHSIDIRLAKKGGAIVRHSLRDKNGPVYDGPGDTEHVFTDRKGLMDHLHKHLGPKSDSATDESGDE